MSDGKDRFERYGQHFLRELAAAKKAQEPWATAANRAWEAFENKGKDLGSGIEALNSAPARVRNFLQKKALNLLWVTIDSQLAHIYSRKPTPMLRRRAGRPNPAEDFAAKMLEKALTVALDDEENDPHRVFKRVTLDMAVAGWGWGEVCYEPEMEEERDPIPVVLEEDEWRDPSGKVVPEAMVEIDPEDPESGAWTPDPAGMEEDEEGEEELPEPTPERTFLRYLNPNRILVHNAEVWEEVEWVATCETPTRRELEDRWDPETIARIKFHDEPEESAPTADPMVGDADHSAAEAEPWDRAKLWRLYDRVNREVVWIDDRAFERMRKRKGSTEDYTQGVEDPTPGSMIVEIEDDELGLTGFLPFPEPLGTVVTSRSIIPSPEFLQYESLYLMIQETVIQYFFLIRAIMVKGLVPGGKKKLVQDMLNSAPWVQVFAATDAGPGATNINEWLGWFPVEQVVNAANNVQNIILALERLMYEVAGSPDTMRGVAHHRASPTVERQKATIGSGRLAMKKDMVEQFARTVLRMMAECMANHFELSTLEEMSGMTLRPGDAIKKDLERAQDDLEEAQQKAKEAEEAGEEDKAPDPAPIAERVAKLEREPSREAVRDVLRKRWRRHFAVDIETDSTVLPDQAMEREQRMQMLESLTRALQALGQLAEARVIGSQTLGKLIASMIETLPMTRELAEELRTFVPPKPEPQPIPEEIRQETQIELARMKGALDAHNAAQQRANQLEIARLRAGVVDRKTDSDAELKEEELELRRWEILVTEMVGKIREHIAAERQKDRTAEAAAQKAQQQASSPAKKKAGSK